MTDHLIKLCVGILTLPELAARDKERRNHAAAFGYRDVHLHQTRSRPVQADRLVAQGGSLYWVIAGLIQARQRLCAIVTLPRLPGDGEVVEGKTCGLILMPELLATRPAPRQAFQGWRYLRREDAPPDEQKNANALISFVNGVETTKILTGLHEFGFVDDDEQN